MGDDKLKKIIPKFIAIVIEALETEFPGGSLQLSKVTAEQETEGTSQTGHYLTFCLPYAGINVEWEILFDPLNPSRPPDFICSEDMECDPVTYCRIVENWDFESEDCLAKLIKDLTGIYQEYQILGFPNAAENLHLLMNSGVLEKNIEIGYSSREKRVNLLVKLDVNDQGLPVVNSGVGRPQVYAGLLYTMDTDGNILSHSLVVSPYLEAILGSHLDQLRLSKSPTQSVDPCVLHDLTGSLETILGKIREDHTRRRHITAAINDLYPDNVVFHDDPLYHSITLLFTLNDARYMVHLKLGDAMELEIFAMDHHVKITKDENAMYHTCEPLSFQENPTSPDFRKNIHETLKTRIEKFINKATNLPPT